MRTRRNGRLGAALLVGVIALTAGATVGAQVIGAGASTAAGAGLAAQAAQATQAPQATAALKALAVTPNKGVVGEAARATVEGLPPGATVELRWETVQGNWVIEDYYHFRGKRFSETVLSLGQFQVGEDGQLDAAFTIPEDYGGLHNIVAAVDDTPVAQGALDLTQSFEMSPQDGPIGTVVEVRVKGLGWQTMESTWVLNWDNQQVGWLSAVNGRGSAVARFRASGPPGQHHVKLYTGYMGQSYLNYQQAPTAYLPRPEFVFRVTPGGAVTEAFAEPYAPQPVPPAESSIGATLGITPIQGPVQTKTTLQGSGLPAQRPLSLIWLTMVGSRVTPTGFEPRETSLGTVETSADGRLSAPVVIPDDLGGLHALVLRDGERELARTYFVVETSIASISPTSGPVGTPVTIHLKGVGWTEYDNIYVATYDNAYMGYACGFNSQGDVVINFIASGAPGVHLVDLYPGLYQGPKEGQQLYRLPQLTYADDHPGNTIPALRFAFTVTES